MKPMTLKESTKCCGSPTLLWMPQKGQFQCPCGEFKTDMDGRAIRTRTTKKGNQQRISRSFVRHWK